MDKHELSNLYCKSVPLFAKLYQEYEQMYQEYEGSEEVYVIVPFLLYGSPIPNEISVKSFILSP